jgi:hypothetical protein
MKDDNGGLEPSSEKRAKAVDLISLPTDVKGTNCGNCRFIMADKSCVHPEVRMSVNDRMCCARWDAQGVIRHFQE